MFSQKIEKILQEVQKPGRYVGGELNSVIKDKNKVDVRYAFCFPDTYEIGMSHLGMKILYSVVNRLDYAWCERVFAPDVDMEEKMRENDIRLWALESGDPLDEFDMLGFTLQYELSYSNILNMLDLAGIPLYSKDRTELAPLVVAGGPCACNGEPIADFIDIFMLGDGEETTVQLVDLIRKHKKLGSPKIELLREVAQLKGFYVPAFYDVEYKEDGTIKSVTNKETAPEKAVKAIVEDMDKVYYPESFVVPSIEVVHDRVTAEIFRGCIRGCRFCQAGFLYRPIREKSPEVVEEQCRTLCESTGYDEISLCSLSTSDYTGLQPLLTSMLKWTTEENINVALPSLRVDNFSDELMEKLTEVRRSSLTFAPEAGTQRLRDAINKNVTYDDVMKTVNMAFSGGWTAVKLYFMIGLPTETYADLDGIVEIAKNIRELNYKINGPKSGRFSLTVSVSNFVPKAHTPFQWMAQDTPEMFEEKHNYLAERLKKLKGVSFNYHDNKTSVYEAVFARGDRRCGKLLYEAFRAGCRLDGWTEYFNRQGWETAFTKSGIDVNFYTTRQRFYDEILPWDIIDSGISKNFLKREAEKALAAQTTRDCRYGCVGCGMNQRVVCPMEGIYGK